MAFAIERLGTVSTVHVVDQLHGTDRGELRRAVLGEIADGTTLLRIDFARARYVDGPGLGLLVSIARTAREHAAELRLVNLDAELRRLFTLTKLDILFTIEPTDDAGDAAEAERPPIRPAANVRGPAEDRASA